MEKEKQQKRKKENEKGESDLTETIPGVVFAQFVWMSVCNEHSGLLKRSC